MSSFDEKLSSRQTDLHLSILFGIRASWVTFVLEKSVVCCQRTRPLSPSFIFIQFLVIWVKKLKCFKKLQFESINYLLILDHFCMFIFSRRPNICCNAHIQQDLKKENIFTQILFEFEKRELKLIELRKAVKTEKSLKQNEDRTNWV